MLKRLFLTLLTCFALIFPGISVCATELQTDIEDSGDPVEGAPSSTTVLEEANATPTKVEELMRAIAGAAITDETPFIVIYDKIKQEIYDGTADSVMVDVDGEYSVYIAYRITDQGYPLWICANERPGFGEEFLKDETFALGAFLAMGTNEDYAELARTNIECIASEDIKFYIDSPALRYDLACVEAIPVAEGAFFGLNGEKIIPKAEPKDANFAGYVRYDFYTKPLSAADDEQNNIGLYDNNDIFYYKPNYVAPKLNSAPPKAEPEVYGTPLDHEGISPTYDDMLWELEELNMQFLKMQQILSVLIWLTIILMFIIGGFIVHYIIVRPKYRREDADNEETAKNGTDEKSNCLGD